MRQLLVYETKLLGTALAGEPENGLRWELLDDATIERLFARDEERARELRTLLRAGHVGVSGVDDAGWVTHGWLATRDGERPSHLPASAAGNLWIFYCRTRADMQGRGYYRATLRRLLEQATRIGPGVNPVVYVDTSPSNRPSRRAIERAGFRGAGRMLTLRAPGSTRTWGVWMRRCPHGR